MSDILFKTDDFIFSYRVAAIIIYDGKVLLQKCINDSSFAFPGGHVAFGETNEETLIRELKEETGADIIVKDLKWVGETFFSWDDRDCHQICLYYIAEFSINPKIPLNGRFIGKEFFEEKTFEIEFFWIPLDTLNDLLVYPETAKELIHCLNDGVKHFISKE